MKDKTSKLFLFLGAFFITNALLAEFIGVKIFSVERTLGFEPLRLSLLGIEDLSFNMTAGVIIWPLVFVLTDIINEYFGKKGVRHLSFLAAGLIAYSYIAVLISIKVNPADFWVGSFSHKGVSDSNTAFAAIFGQGLWIIAGSLIAFLLGQFIDVVSFRFIRKYTGKRMIWLRATGSTLISQLIDSYIVLFVAFYIGGNWTLNQFIAIGTVNYIYKFIIAIAVTPLLYLAHNLIDKYLGKEKAEQLSDNAI